jgi:hypothetical protein
MLLVDLKTNVFLLIVPLGKKSLFLKKQTCNQRLKLFPAQISLYSYDLVSKIFENRNDKNFFCVPLAQILKT